jgi:hypothetical protein
MIRRQKLVMVVEESKRNLKNLIFWLLDENTVTVRLFIPD